MRFVLPLALLTLTTSLAAEAATISASKRGYISIVGEIVPGDELAFADELKRFTPGRPAEVRLDSRGGSVVTALAIAEIVHKAGLTAHVPYRGQCYSACVIIFAAAQERMANAESMIGVHSAGVRAQENDATFAVTTMLARVMAEYGAPPSVIGKMVMTPTMGITTLTIADLEAWKVTISRSFAERQAPQSTPVAEAVTAEQMVRFVVGPDNSIDRAMQFFSWPWDEKVRYIKSVGGQDSKICFNADDCIHQTEALTFNRKYSYVVRSNPRINQNAFCVTSFERGREACYIEGSGEVLFLHNSDGQWKKLPTSTALSMIN